MELADAIRLERADMIATGQAKTYFEINNGLCDELATGALERLGGESDSVFFVESGNFTLSGEPGGDWDWALLRKAWRTLPPAELTRAQVDAIDFGVHVWITDGKRHYDAECPDGVDSLFALPLFRRYVVTAVRESGMACDDVVTDDVGEVPGCPVANPGAQSISATVRPGGPG